MSDQKQATVEKYKSLAIASPEFQALPNEVQSLVASTRKYKCGACGESVAYGAHCSKVPRGDLSKDKAHADFASSKGYLYEEDVT